MSSIQQYQHFLREVEAHLKKTHSEAFQALRAKLLDKDYSEEHRALAEKVFSPLAKLLKDYELQIQIQQTKSLEIFKETLKQNVEQHYQSYIHNQTMRQQRIKSRQSKKDETERVLQQRIEDIYHKQQTCQEGYIQSFEEEFEKQNKPFHDKLERLEFEIKQHHS